MWPFPVIACLHSFSWRLSHLDVLCTSAAFLLPTAEQLLVSVMLKGTSTVFTNLPLFLSKNSTLFHYVISTPYSWLRWLTLRFCSPTFVSFWCDTELANMFEWRLLKRGCWQKDNKHLQKLLHPSWQNEQEMTSEENTVIHCLLGLFWRLIMCNSTAF